MNYKVFLSFAEEMKKAATFGGVGLAFLGYSQNVNTLTAIILWWVCAQAIAHYLIHIASTWE
jgi:hypothetical protein